MSGFIEKVENRYVIIAESADFKKLEDFLKKVRAERVKASPAPEAVEFLNGMFDDYDKFLSDVKTRNLQDEFLVFIRTARKVSQEDQLKAFKALSAKLQKLLKGAFLITPFGVNPVLYGWANALE